MPKLIRSIWYSFVIPSKNTGGFLGEWQTYSLARRAEMIFRLMADVQPETICRKIYASQRQQYPKHWKPI